MLAAVRDMLAAVRSLMGTSEVPPGAAAACGPVCLLGPSLCRHPLCWCISVLPSLEGRRSVKDVSSLNQDAESAGLLCSRSPVARRWCRPTRQAQLGQVLPRLQCNWAPVGGHCRPA